MGTRKRARPTTISGDHYTPLLEKAADFYHKTLQREGDGFEVLRRHGLTETDLVERFRIGYCNGRLLELLPDEESVRGTLLELGVLEEADGDGKPTLQERLLECLVFPLHDLDGGLVSLFGVPVDTGAAVLLPNGPGV